MVLGIDFDVLITSILKGRGFLCDTLYFYGGQG